MNVFGVKPTVFARYAQVVAMAPAFNKAIASRSLFEGLFPSPHEQVH